MVFGEPPPPLTTDPFLNALPGPPPPPLLLPKLPKRIPEAVLGDVGLDGTGRRKMWGERRITYISYMIVLSIYLSTYLGVLSRRLPPGNRSGGMGKAEIKTLNLER